MAERAQCTANRKKTPANYENNFVNFTTHALQMLTTQPNKETHCKYSQHNQTKKRTANKILYLVVLWAFSVQFFIWLCCEHLQHLLSNWWRCFLDLLVLFLFAHVFWSCSALSSLGHHTKWFIILFFTANLLVHMDGLWLTNLLITLFTSAPFLGQLYVSLSLSPSIHLCH